MPRKKKEPELKEYLCRGTLSLTGVQFTIMAESQEEAEEKARNGEWHDYDVQGASSNGCQIYAATVEENI